MAYGTPARTRRRRGLLHRHPPGPAADARAAGRPAWRRYDAIGGLSPLAERTEAQRAALAARARRAGARPVRGRARPEARRALRSRTRSPPWPPTASRAAVGLVLAPHYSAASRRRVPRAGREGGGRRPASTTAPSSAGTSSRPTSTSWPPPSPTAWPTLPAEHQGAVHRPLAAGAGPRRRRPLPRASSGRRPTAVAERAGLAPWGGWSVGWQTRRAHARAVARARHPARSSSELAGTGRGDRRRSCARSGFVADHLEVLYDLDIEARRRADERGPRLRPHAGRQRRPGRAWRALADLRRWRGR